MIRFLQTPGPIKKIILSGLLLVILRRHGDHADSRAALAYSIGLGRPGREWSPKWRPDITTLEVQREARQMLKQQFPQYGPSRPPCCFPILPAGGARI